MLEQAVRNTMFLARMRTFLLRERTSATVAQAELLNTRRRELTRTVRKETTRSRWSLGRPLPGVPNLRDGF